MRWEQLFEDFEQQLDDALLAEQRDIERDEQHLAWSRMHLVTRLRHEHEVHSADAICAPLLLTLSGVEYGCTIDTVGYDWMTATLRRSHSPLTEFAILPLSSIESVTLRCDCTAAFTADTRSPAARIPLPIVLRDLARRARPVVVHVDRDDLAGRLSRVGADWCEVTLEHGASSNNDRLTVPLAQLRYVVVVPR